MSERKAKENRKNKFYAPAKSSQAHRRDRRDGSRFDYVNEDWTLQRFRDEWENDALHLDCSVQRPQDLFGDNTKNGVTTTVINNGAIHQIQVHSYTVDGAWHHDVYNGGNRIDFILFGLIGDCSVNQDDKFRYTSPEGELPVIENKSFDEMPDAIRKKIKAFDGIAVEVVKHLSDNDLGAMMRQGNTTEPMNESHECNTAVNDYRNTIRVVTMEQPMCPSPVPGLSQHDIFATLLKNNSKKALGHFQFVSWLAFPRFHKLYKNETIYDGGGSTNTKDNRTALFIGPNDSAGIFEIESSRQRNKNKIHILADQIQQDLDRYGLLTKISRDEKLDFHPTGSGGLHGSNKMGPMYFLLGLEQTCGSGLKFKLKDAKLFLTEFTKARKELMKNVIEAKTGNEVSSTYANKQGGWTAEDWKIKNTLLFTEMMEGKESPLEIGFVFLDAERFFSKEQKIEISKNQRWKCAITGKPFKEADISDMDADHIFPWSKGGSTLVPNGRMVCRKEHQELAFDYIPKNKKDTSDNALYQ
jgi:hypothetical protein